MSIESFKSSKLNRLLFREKPVYALVCLGREGEWYASILAKAIDCTYPHIVKIIKDFKALGLIVVKEEGRRKRIELTRSGRAVSQALTESSELFEREGKKG